MSGSNTVFANNTTYAYRISVGPGDVLTPAGPHADGLASGRRDAFTSLRSI